MLLGGAFLASTYVYVDYERNAFGLAPAVTGKRATNQSDIQTVCSLDQSIPPRPSIPSPSPGSATTASVSATTASGAPSRHGLSESDKIQIGVGVPGGIAGLLAVIGLFMGIRRHYRKKSRRQQRLELDSQELEMKKRQLDQDRAELDRRQSDFSTRPTLAQIQTKSYSPIATRISDEFGATRYSPYSASRTIQEQPERSVSPVSPVSSLSSVLPPEEGFVDHHNEYQS
jgi:uncharacterized membrane-anchored protein YhcB (DUF1043 family)